MNLTPALASPGSGHAGRASLFGAASIPVERERASSGRGVAGRVSAWVTPERVSLACLLALTAALYFVGLSASGFANEFYAAAAQAGSQSWWAFLWGSSDAASSITVDKPPASLWLPALFVRVFGLSSWAILAPQAIMGVLSVWLLYAIVRRDFGHWCALLAGAGLALTPVACLMFRFNNPDALLVLLLLSCAYCVMRAVGAEKDVPGNQARTRWMALGGVAMGLAFLTKQLQAFLVLPGLGLAFLVASPTSLRRRLLDAAVALAVTVLAAGWWVALTVLVPAGMRPYIGGSETNSFVELTFWYNGLGRIFGNTVGSGSMARQGILMGTGGEASLARLLSGVWATQWSWLFWAALVGLCLVLVRAGKSARTDRRRAQALVWGGWLGVTFLVFSLMEGTIHQYYTVALAPAVAALAAMGARVLWESRDHLWARCVAATTVALTAAWACVLVSGTTWLVAPLTAVVVCLAAGSAALVVAGEVARRRGRPVPARAAEACVALAVLSCLLVPAAYSVYTASTGHHGSIVTAGPSVTGSDAMGAGPGGNGGGTAPGGGSAPSGTVGGNGGGTAPGGGSAPSGNGSAPSGNGSAPSAGGGAMDGGVPAGGNGLAPDGNGSAPSDGGGNSPALGGDGASSVSDEVSALLLDDADAYTWVAAAVGSQSAASYQLATERSVMPIGGFNGSDPSPTLEEFKSYVEEGRIHYFISGGNGGGQGASSDEESIAAWVAENYEAVTVDGVTLYDLTQPLA